MPTRLATKYRLGDWGKMNAPGGYVNEADRTRMPPALAARLPAGVDHAIRMSLGRSTPQNSYDVSHGGHRVQLQGSTSGGQSWPEGVTRVNRFWFMPTRWPDTSSPWQIVTQVKQAGGTPGADLQYRGGRLLMTAVGDTDRGGALVPLGTPVEVWWEVKPSRNGFMRLYIDGAKVADWSGNTSDDAGGNGYPCMDIYIPDRLAGDYREFWFAGWEMWDGLPTTPPPPPPSDPCADVATERDRLAASLTERNAAVVLARDDLTKIAGSSGSRVTTLAAARRRLDDIHKRARIGLDHLAD